MERLKHRGPDGRDEQMAGHVALGHWHFWTTPEEVGERQPLELAGMLFKIVLDGRLDNRSELLNSLHIEPQRGSRLSDAALILHAYAHWGEHCFERFIGEFALVILDQHRGELLCARDALGDRTLFYSFKGTRLVVASEPWAITGADGSCVDLNESAVAHYFALKATEDGQTLFKNIYQLLPARVMAVTASGHRTWRYWQPDPSIRLRGRSDKEYADEFRSLLEESVRCRLRSITLPGVVMSGGLDSTSVTCLAARMLAPATLTTISYVFDELPDCDERQFINAVKDQWGIRSIQIPCDDIWPYKDSRSWPRNPNWPDGNPYRLIKERTSLRAKTEGFTVMLTGGFGDHLYTSWQDWLSDSIVDRRFQKAGQELISLSKRFGLLKTLNGYAVRRVFSRALNKIPGGKRFHRKSEPLPWLTSFAAAAVGLPEPGSLTERYATLVGLGAASSVSKETFYTSRHGIELRQPYRDQRLIEFVLTLPAYQLYAHGQLKYILRTAMRGILPEIIRTRRRPTSLTSLFFRGVEQEQAILEPIFENFNSAWADYVQADWILRHWNADVTPENDGPAALVPWLCFSFDLWHQLSLCYNAERS